MKSKNTHLMWNDSLDTKGMRQLAEFTELSRRMATNEIDDGYFFGKV